MMHSSTLCATANGHRLTSGDHRASRGGARARRYLLVIVGAALALAGCQPDAGPGQPVENAALGIVIAPLPAPFEVTDNAGETLRLAVDGDATRGEAEFHLGPPRPRGINLVDEAIGRKEYFESRPDGSFAGNQEIVAPIGPIYTARGSYDTANGPVEEIWALTVLPGTDRLLSIVYRYPAGDSSHERAQHLLALLENLAASKTP